MSKIIIITGMHRSGTSLMTSILQKAGLNIGQELLAPGKENPRGFFEDVGFFNFHEQALHNRGQSYLVTEPFAFTPTTEETTQATRLVQQRHNLPIWGWKDPRTTLFLDFWHQILPQAQFLFLFRHPLEVLLSLINRNYAHTIGLLEGIKAWHVYNTHIKTFYQAHQEQCLLCHISGFTDHIEEFNTLLHQKLGLNLAITPQLFQSLYHPKDMKRAVITKEFDWLLEQIYPQAIELYKHLNNSADMPAPANQTTAPPPPDLPALRQLVSTLPAPQKAPYPRGLLLFLMAQLAPENTESFYQNHKAYLLETELARDKFWNDLQTLSKSWNEQRRYIEKLHNEPIPQAKINRLSSQEIGHRIPVKKLWQAIGYKIRAKIMPAHQNTATDDKAPTQIEKQESIAEKASVSSGQSEQATILMVYPDLGSPTRYRVMNQAAQMELAGFNPILHSADDPTAANILPLATLLYLYRVEASLEIHHLVKLAKKQQIPVVFDTDDLIWDPQLESYCFMPDNLSNAEIEGALSSIKRHELVMFEADCFVASTPYLANLIKTHFGKPVYINKNALSKDFQNLAEPFYQTRLKKNIPAPSAPVTICYASGWPKAHQEDFEIAIEPLRRLLKERSQTRIKIIGYIKTDKLFPGYKNRLRHQPFVKWNHYPKSLSRVDINLAPIIDNPHRRSKSAVKFLEAGFLGIPTVAGNLEPYQDITHGETGFLAATENDWYHCLLQLIDSPQLRRDMGIAARTQIAAQDTVQRRAPQFKQTLNQIIKDYYGQ